MFIWDQNGTTIDKYVDIPHRKSNYDLFRIHLGSLGQFITGLLDSKDLFSFIALNISPISDQKQRSTMKRSRNYLLQPSQVFKNIFPYSLRTIGEQPENFFKKEKVSLKSGQKLSPSQADPTKLYAGDLESTIYHMTLNEIPSVEYIEGTRNQHLLVRLKSSVQRVQSVKNRIYR